ncbi:MEDS domain-containing protein [Virgibacillus litoralis]|uniref:MEDS domain-containing protein n=1 Tax=Virgibacillus litoralis TaxID=578221 RepID=A0ABS4H9S9_9BACI|nr:MEDS domain-containing protein [Virgibacillus litoralis]MBP1947192.1 hypothetical protein [Virgibacillus litoralis]
MIPLTKYLQEFDSAHILYVFEEKNNYIENMMAYIKAGTESGHHLIIIENQNVFHEVEEKIKKLYSNEEQKYIHHIDNYSFYRSYTKSHMQSIVKHFHNKLNACINENSTIRTWAHVEWKSNNTSSNKLEEFDNIEDCSLSEIGIMSVCAYDASAISASLQTKLLRNHEYFMTDKELVRSSLFGIPKKCS